MERVRPLVDGNAPGQCQAPHRIPCPRRCVSHPGPTGEAIFKDVALREQCVVETIWEIDVTEPR